MATSASAPPVVVRKPLSQSARETVFDIPGSVLYRVEAKLPDGTTRIFEDVRAYANSVKVDQSNGHVSLAISSKSSHVWSGLVPYPYHHLHQNTWLGTLKINKMETMSDDDTITVALNYNLFCLPWEFCVILHDPGDGMMAVQTTREEWDHGELTSRNREVQMFLGVSKHRLKSLAKQRVGMHSDIADWMDDAEAAALRKKK